MKNKFDLTDRKILHRKGNFVLVEDEFPISPGHLLIIADEKTGYENFFDIPIKDFNDFNILINEAKYHIGISMGLCPDGYNIGMNCGESAGQTINQFHCHIIPRYKGDVENPKGGVRWVIPEKADYKKDEILSSNPYYISDTFKFDGNIEVSDKLIEELQEKIKDGPLYGEFGFPSKFDISTNNVSHIIEEVTKLGNGKIYVKARILDTVYGSYVQKTIKSHINAEYFCNTNYKFSPRMTGVLINKDNNSIFVVKQLFTFDLIERNRNDNI